MNPAIEARLTALGVRMADVDERFIRGSGHGGQKVNKTSSTVWLRHGATGIEVRAQQERSQRINRERAWSELCDKLEERKRTVEALRQQERAKDERRQRQKSRAQKLRMIQSKKHRASIKARRKQAEAD